MSHNRLSGIIIAAAVVMAGGIALAQVTVNAPKGLLNRGGAQQQETPKQQDEPAATAGGGQAASVPQEGDQSQQQAASAAAGTDSATVASGKPHGITLSPEEIDNFSFSNQVIVGTAAGYRVQVFFSSERGASEAANSRARQIALQFPHHRDYISYNAPQWRLRVGDFARRADAERAMRLIKRKFPEFRGEVAVVRDHINLWH